MYFGCSEWSWMTGSVNSANFCLMYKLLFVGAGLLNFCKLFIN